MVIHTRLIISMIDTCVIATKMGVFIEPVRESKYLRGKSGKYLVAHQIIKNDKKFLFIISFSFTYNETVLLSIQNTMLKIMFKKLLTI